MKRSAIESAHIQYYILQRSLFYIIVMVVGVVLEVCWEGLHLELVEEKERRELKKRNVY